MPAATTKCRYLSKNFNEIVLRYPVPQAAQLALGRKMFRVILAQTDMDSVQAAPLRILAAPYRSRRLTLGDEDRVP
jgi:hypothetical protein